MTTDDEYLRPVPKRPVPIIIICVIGFLGALFALPLIFSQAAHDIGAWYPPYLTASAGIGAVALLGLWMMRRWAVYLYTAMTAINQAVLLYMHVWNPLALIVPGIIVIVMFIYIRRMQ
jgi:hypothetical protein